MTTVTQNRSVIVTTRVSPQLDKSLSTFAIIADRPKSYILETAVQEYVDRNAWMIKALQKTLSNDKETDYVSSELVDTWIEKNQKSKKFIPFKV